MTEELSKEHLSIRGTKLADASLDSATASKGTHAPDKTTELYTKLLWLFSSWSIVLANLVCIVIALKDMYNVGYNPTNHLFAIVTFLASIGGIQGIYNYIIKGNFRDVGCNY